MNFNIPTTVSIQDEVPVLEEDKPPNNIDGFQILNVITNTKKVDISDQRAWIKQRG